MFVALQVCVMVFWVHGTALWLFVFPLEKRQPKFHAEDGEVSKSHKSWELDSLLITVLDL